MPAAGRPRALDEDKQATVCSLVAGGVSLRQAATFVDCDPRSIRREAERNDDFRRQLAKAKSEASIHPLQTLQQAAKADWRAALCWMERLDPNRFARPDASVVTKREANQLVSDLIAAIERAVCDPQQRADLYELLSAAMPVAMRRRWDGRGARRNLEQAMRDFDKKRDDEVKRRCKRRREFTGKIASYLPWELLRELGDYHDVFDPDVILADRAHAAARRMGASEKPHDDGLSSGGPTNGGPTNGDTTNGGRTDDGLTPVGLTNNASPGDDFVPPPGRNPRDIASPPPANLPLPHDLPPRAEANSPE